MKGFKDSNNKFHPITNKKGVRKSRDQKTKLDGVKIRKLRGHDAWVTRAPPDPEQEALEDIVSGNTNLSAEEIAKLAKEGACRSLDLDSYEGVLLNMENGSPGLLANAGTKHKIDRQARLTRMAHPLWLESTPMRGEGEES